jgi:hypothetical protein
MQNKEISTSLRGAQRRSNPEKRTEKKNGKKSSGLGGYAEPCGFHCFAVRNDDQNKRPFRDKMPTKSYLF